MATSHVELEGGESIEDSVQILLNCKEKGRDLGNQRLPSIYMVPSAVRDLSPRSFTPTVVSIGPLHKQDKNLQAYEVQKMIYLHGLVDRSGSNQEETFRKCMQKVMGKIEEIKACYAEPTIYKDAELGRMMVIDACFILYFVHLLTEEDGPNLGNKLLTSNILKDLVLIENQIPFFVLEDIFESTILRFKPETSLIDHMQISMKSYLGHPSPNLYTTHDHILGLLQKYFQPAHDIPSGSEMYPKRHSAVELDRAGVKFTPNEDVNWSMAMKVELLPKFSWFPWFWRKPTLMMPILLIADDTDCLFRNLIIYEQYSLVPNYLTTYMWAICMLIDTPQDIAVLVKSGVLYTYCSDEDALNMIHNVCKDVLVETFVYDKEWEQLDTYYNSYWPNAVAGLKRTYFNSPWKMIALFAGIVLFLLTVVQTIFTIKAAN